MFSFFVALLVLLCPVFPAFAEGMTSLPQGATLAPASSVVSGELLRAQGVASPAGPVEGATLAPAIARFFRMGDGRVQIRNVHNGLRADVRLLKEDGSFDEKALKAVDMVFGLSSSPDGEHIAPRLLFLLDYFSDRLAPGRVLQLQSGYRPPAYNQKLRRMGRNVALTSTHMDAMAIDFFIDGVEGKYLWEMIRKEECCGVGHYGGRTIHLDSGRPRFWEAATSRVSSGESESNRRVYLSTRYDRYVPGETVDLTLVSISDFGFGIIPDILLLGNDGIKEQVRLADAQQPAACVPVIDRKRSSALKVALPHGLVPGLYRVGIRFCGRPSELMPLETWSNQIEVVSK